MARKSLSISIQPQPSDIDTSSSAGNMVDVREVARAHVECIKQESAGNNRWAITNCPFTWQQALDVANADENVKKAFPKLPTGTAGSGDNTKQNSALESLSVIDLRCAYEQCSLRWHKEQDEVGHPVPLVQGFDNRHE